MENNRPSQNSNRLGCENQIKLQLRSNKCDIYSYYLSDLSDFSKNLKSSPENESAPFIFISYCLCSKRNMTFYSLLPIPNICFS